VKEFARRVEGEGRRRVWCIPVWIGDDIILCVGGGDKPHIGAVSISLPYRKEGGRWAVSTSTFTIPSHRDNVLTRLLAEKVSKKTGKRVVVVGGVHIDGASREDIEEVIRNTCKLAEGIAAELGRREA